MTATMVEITKRPIGYNRTKQAPDVLWLSAVSKIALQTYHQDSRNRDVSMIRNSLGTTPGPPEQGGSCHNTTPFCDSCYAKRATNYQHVDEALAHNLYLLQLAGTAEAISELYYEALSRFYQEVQIKGIPSTDWIFKPNWAGDIISEEHAQGLAKVVRIFSKIQHFIYIRAYTEALDVLRWLVGIPNLQVYLSTDAANAEAAFAMAAKYPEVHLAYCGETEDEAKALIPEGSDRHVVSCPENTGRIRLVGETGKGACITCRYCVEGRGDVVFFNKKPGKARLRRNRQEKTVVDKTPQILVCENTECFRPNREFPWIPKQGIKPKYCGRTCQTQAYYRRTHPASAAKIPWDLVCANPNCQDPHFTWVPTRGIQPNYCCTDCREEAKRAAEAALTSDNPQADPHDTAIFALAKLILAGLIDISPQHIAKCLRVLEGDYQELEMALDELGSGKLDEDGVRRCGYKLCRKPLPPHKGRGRPKGYCNRQCSNAASQRNRAPSPKYVPHNKQDEGKTRTCNICQQLKPIGEFLKRSDTNFNSRRGECDACRREYRQRCYISPRISDALGHYFRLLVQPDSPFVGDTCEECGNPFEVGQHVATDDVVLIHHGSCRDKIVSRNSEAPSFA